MKLALSILLVLTLALGGCATKQPAPPTPPAPSDPLTALEASIAGVEMTVALMTTGGVIPTAIALGIENALAPMPQIYSQTMMELATADSTAVKALKIENLYQPVLVSLGALPPAAQVYVVAISAGIRAFLAFYPAQGLTASKVAHVVNLDPTRTSTILLRAGRLDTQLKALKAR